MAASFSDMAFLSKDAAFATRVGSALWQTCTFIASEAWSKDHAARKQYVTQILNNPNFYAPFFVNAVSVDASVIADATAAGTVALTSGSVATQGALVTDAHIANAISAAFNAFISGL